MEAARSIANLRIKGANRVPARPREIHAQPLVDDALFDRWVTQEYESVYRFLLVRTRSEDEARDLTQETFVKAYRARNRFHADRPLKPWLFAIALNCQRDSAKRKRRIEVPLDDTFGQPERIGGTLADEIENVMPWLTEEQRITLHLRVAERLSFKEIGEVLRCSEAAAKMRVQRAKRRLAKLLKRTIVACEDEG